MAAVQQHTPSSESRQSKAFMDSMEEEMRRCSEHLQRRQSKRVLRTLNGYGRGPDDGEEAGANRRFASTLPRSFTMPSHPETRELTFSRSSRRKSNSPSRQSSRSPRTPTLKAPIGATLHDSFTRDQTEREQVRTPEYRGRSAPPEVTSAYSYYTSSSGSEFGCSSRESSRTPLEMASRSSSSSPRSSMSPPPVAPKPTGKSRERAWSNKRRNKAESSPKVIRAKPEDSSSSQSTIPVSNQPIQVPLSPMEFPSADIENSFSRFSRISSHTPPPKSEPKFVVPEPKSTTPEWEFEPTSVAKLLSTQSESPSTEPELKSPTLELESETKLTPPKQESKPEEKLEPKPMTSEEKLETTTLTLESDHQGVVDTVPEAKTPDSSTTVTECDQVDSVEQESKSLVEETRAEESLKSEVPLTTTEGMESNTKNENGSSPPPVEVKPHVSDEQLLKELTSPEVKTVPRAIRRRSTSSSKTEVGARGADGAGRKRHSRNLSESKIHITVSSSVKMGEVIQATQDKAAADDKPLEPADEKMAAMIKDLQAQLREKEEQLSRVTEQRDKEILQRDEQIKKQIKDNKKIEREKWELLKRARDAAERALLLRTQLDVKEGTMRSTQSELDRTKDELFSVKSANTSLRALLSKLRAPRSNTSGVEVGVQVDIIGGTLKRHPSMELAFTEGGMSEDGLENSLERSTEFRASSTSLSLYWPQRSNSDKWEREDVVSLSGDIPSGTSVSQPNVPWPDLKKGKRKRSGLLAGRLRRSTGSKRGSVTSVDGLDMSNSSILQGAGMRGTHPITFPYHVVPTDTKEHWRLMEQAQSIAFQDWTLQHVIAWTESGLGMSQYSEAIREKASSGSAMLSLNDSDLEKKLGIYNPLHRKKLRLAIEEQKDPSSCPYPHAGKIDHSWVAFEWAHDCGLAHLTEVLVTNLVDGRLLNKLNKEDIRKHLKITKKTDQLSFLSAVELLRMHDFNRQAIQEHRQTANNALYWTNRDVCNWLKDIQLEEYATNVIGGGVHGALLFLERGHFTPEHLANIIQIPSSKGQLRRHLAGKMARLFTEDVSQSIESLPTHLMLSGGSPARLSPQGGSPSPDRRAAHHSPHHISGSPPASRKNSLSSQRSHMLYEALSQPVPTATPKQFSRASSGPSPRQQRMTQVAAAERVRHSLRESALKSVSSINGDTASRRPDLPPRSFTPTVLSSTGTTV